MFYAPCKYRYVTDSGACNPGCHFIKDHNTDISPTFNNSTILVQPRKITIGSFK